MKLFSVISFLLAPIFASAQLTTEIQTKRGLFTERLYLNGKWIDGISTNLYSPDSLADNMLVTAKGASDYIRLQADNAIPNQYAASLPGNFWIQGAAVIGAYPNYKRNLFSQQPAQVYVTQNNLQHGLTIQRSSSDLGAADIELFKNAGAGFNLQGLQPGDSIGSIIFSGMAGDHSTVANAASLHGLVEKTAPNYLSSGFVFNTTDTSGQFRQRMWLNAQGNLLLGNAVTNEYGLNVTSGDVRIGSMQGNGNILLASDNNGVLRKLSIGENLGYEDGYMYLNAVRDPDDGNYERHVSILSQTGTNAPTSLVLTGEYYQLARVATGVYTVTTNWGFAPGFTWLKSEPSDSNGDAVYTKLYISGDRTITLIVKDASGNNTDNWEGISIEIKQYPMN